MRYTDNRNGVWVIPERFHDAAVEKLVRFEDTEELEDVQAYCIELKRAADEKERTEPDLANLLKRAADEIVKMSNFRDSAAARLMEKQNMQKKELLTFLDDIDGQILDDPVSVIREKLEEVLQ